MEFITEYVPNTKSQYFTIQFKNGLNLKILFSGKVGTSNIEKYKAIWQFIATHEEKIKFLPKGNDIYIYLPPVVYWDIYKRLEGGTTLIKKYSYTDINSGKQYYFPDPSMYFDNTFSSLNGGNGIYGIYHNDQLIYIGYTVNGFQNRFDQHRENFQIKSCSSPMYSKYDLQNIGFRELITENEIQQLFRIVDPIDKEIFKLIEYCLISVLQPSENREGVTTDYSMHHTSMREILDAGDQVSIIHMIRKWLLYNDNLFGKQIINPDDIFNN